MDAVSGEIVDVHSRIQTALSRTIKNANYANSFGTNVRTEGAGPTGNPTYDTNYDNLGIVYDYYSSVFSRDSLDNAGMGLISTTNFNAIDGTPYNGAFWSGTSQQMFFGDGDGSTFNNFVVALDVSAHELTHGVTEKESGLIYANEPGALNEAMSDVLGAAAETYSRSGTVDSKTWKIGEDLYIASNQLRRLDDPTTKNYYKDFYLNRHILATNVVPDEANNDWGYVHWNSTIASLAFKLLVTGGQHPHPGGSIPTTNTSPLDATLSVSMSKAEQIFYLANTVYLGPGAQFVDARAATVQAAQDLYGSGAASTVAIAWDVVGVPSFSNRNPINISTYANVGTGGGIMGAGFVLNGGGSAKTLLIRAVGPTLANSPFNLTGVLADPQLNLFDSNHSNIGSNDDWSSSGNAATIASTAAAVGAFSLQNPSSDSAMLASLSAGLYTAEVNGASSGTGIALVEIYDTDTSNPNHLINLSTRAQVGTGANIVIAGFVISGSGNKYLLIRGIGPALSGSPFYLSGVLSDPKIELFNSGGTKIRENDDWRYDENNVDLSGQIAGVATAVGAFSLSPSSKDSALLVSLPAGTYTVQLSGVGATTGIGLIELYEVP